MIHNIVFHLLYLFYLENIFFIFPFLPSSLFLFKPIFFEVFFLVFPFFFCFVRCSYLAFVHASLPTSPIFFLSFLFEKILQNSWDSNFSSLFGSLLEEDKLSKGIPIRICRYLDSFHFVCVNLLDVWERKSV